MKKYYVLTDIHGFYKEMIEALGKENFDISNDNHILVSCGDIFDRGRDPIKCLEFVNSLPENRKVLIRGNHEDLIEDCLNRNEFLHHDYHNGTVETVVALGNMVGSSDDALSVFANAKRNPLLAKYLGTLVDYAEIGNYIFVPGWIPCFRNDDNKFHARNVTYIYDPNWRTGSFPPRRRTSALRRCTTAASRKWLRCWKRNG